MKYFLLSMIVALATFKSAFAEAVPKKCVRDGYELQFSAQSIHGSYNYWEAYPGSSHSPVLIEHFDHNDDLRWTLGQKQDAAKA